MIYSSAYIRFQKQKEAYSGGDKETVKKLGEEARQELESKGFLKTNLFGWIEKEWLDKGLVEGVIVKIKDGYVPVATEREEATIEGYRGRNPITSKKTILDISRFLDFLERYETHRNKKERQHFAINEDMNSLIEDTISKDEEIK